VADDPPAVVLGRVDAGQRFWRPRIGCWEAPVSAGVIAGERIRELAGEGVPGVVVLVAGPEGVRAAGAAGLADIAGRVPASPGMVCPWFSMTKVVTATAAMRLAERGLLDLDAPIAGHVPALRQVRPAGWASRITARHLLSHSAGLANPIPVRWVHPADQPAPDPDTFLRGLLARHRKLRFVPGSRARYSNLGPLVLAAALTTATGQQFTDLIAAEILRPLGMAATAFSYTPQTRTRAAVGYHPRRSPMRLLLPRWAIGAPAGRWISLQPFLVDGPAYGGLVGPVDELARFLQLHLRDGELDGTRVLSPQSAAAMRQITMPGRHYDLGLGWFRPASQRHADPPFVQHLGGGAGFFNLIRIYPTRGVGVAVMGNVTTYPIDAVARLALTH
jgi:CubicO group peptidase (beta-lactamase class C family)